MRPQQYCWSKGKNKLETLRQARTEVHQAGYERRFPRREINQHLGIRFPSFCSEDCEICR
jgi:hypothetical protein